MERILDLMAAARGVVRQQEAAPDQSHQRLKCCVCVCECVHVCVCVCEVEQLAFWCVRAFACVLVGALSRSLMPPFLP